ncbi:MAG: hypothetical protein V7631_764 [Massilia sp.]|jgi:hypothetical protein
MHLTSTTAALLPTATCAGLILFSLCGGACAETGLPDWKFSGFGTAGVVHTNEKQADFAVSLLKGDGAGRTSAWSRHVDSRVGGQVDLTFNARWSAVVQVVSEQRHDHSYQPHIEWANVKYQATPELAVRLGRIALPMFIAADYRKVGYAYPWVRMPLEVYGVQPISNSDGADITWHWEGENLRSTTQAFYGHTDMALYDGARLRGTAIAGLSHTVEHGALSARASVITTNLTVSLYREVFEALDGFGPPGRDIARRYIIADKHATVASVGLNYDPGEWFVTAEAGRTKVNGFLGSTKSMYVSGGYRYDDLTPYAGFARVWGTPPAGAGALSLADLPPAYAATGALVNATLASIVRAIQSQSTITAGLRWDLAPNMALKLQHERITTPSGSRGMLINSVPDFVSGRTAQVSSAALDFVF